MYKSVSDFYAGNINQNKLVKLHLGCGSKYLPEWCNIDAYPCQESDTHRGNDVSADIWCDIARLPAESNSVDVIYTSHVIEHFYRHAAIELFVEFFRVLKPRGVVITEMPDLAKILLLLRMLPRPPKYPMRMNANRDMIKAQLYGAAWEANDAGYPYHKYVWERFEFCQMLSEIGFKILLQTGATQSHVPFRDMAVICCKPPDAGLNCHSKINHSEILAPYGTKAFRAKKQLISIFNLILTCSIGVHESKNLLK